MPRRKRKSLKAEDKYRVRVLEGILRVDGLDKGVSGQPGDLVQIAAEKLIDTYGLGNARMGLMGLALDALDEVLADMVVSIYDIVTERETVEEEALDQLREDAAIDDHKLEMRRLFIQEQQKVQAEIRESYTDAQKQGFDAAGRKYDVKLSSPDRQLGPRAEQILRGHKKFERNIPILVDGAFDGVDKAVDKWIMDMKGQPSTEAVARLFQGLLGENLPGALEKSYRGQEIRRHMLRIGAIQDRAMLQQGSIARNAKRIMVSEMQAMKHHSSAYEATLSLCCSYVQWNLSEQHDLLPSSPDDCDIYALWDQGYGTGTWRPDDVPALPHPFCACKITPIVLPKEEWWPDLETKMDIMGLPPQPREPSDEQVKRILKASEQRGKQAGKLAKSPTLTVRRVDRMSQRVGGEMHYSHYRNRRTAKQRSQILAVRGAPGTTDWHDHVRGSTGGNAPDATLEKAMEKAHDMIGRVHDFKFVDKVYVRSVQGLSTYGQFDDQWHSIDMRRGLSDNKTLAGYLHNFGHAIDLGRVDRSTWGHDAVKSYEHLVSTIANSRAINEIKTNSKGLLNDAGQELLLRTEEQFARAYHQYIVTKTDYNNKDLWDEINSNYHYGWWDDDFKPITEAFDKFFESTGWKEKEGQVTAPQDTPRSTLRNVTGFLRGTTAKTKQVVYEAHELIDKVLDIDMGKYKFSVGNNDLNNRGHYAHKEININPTKSKEQQLITYLHEFGHAIDFSTLKYPGFDSEAYRHKSTFASADHAWNKSSSKFLRKGTELWKDIAKSIENSETIKKVRDTANNDSSQERRNFYAFLDKGEEKWARAFNQYILERAAPDNDALWDKLLVEGYQGYGWPRDDFKPIAEAFDKFFEAKGMLRQPAKPKVEEPFHSTKENIRGFLSGIDPSTIKAVKHAHEMIDKVLDVKFQTKIHVGSDRNTKHEAYYQNQTHEIRLKPTRSVKVQTGNYLHEFAHAFDYLGLKVRDDWPIEIDQSAYKLAGIQKMNNRDKVEPWAKLNDAIRKSRGIKELRAARNRLRYNRQTAADTRKFEQYNYLLSPQELFARAFHQYIVTKTAYEDAEHWKTVNRAEHWSWWDDDFKPIMEAFDELFESQGMLRK